MFFKEIILVAISLLVSSKTGMMCQSGTTYYVTQDQSGPSYEQIKTLLEEFVEERRKLKGSASRTSSQSETSREAWAEVRAKLKVAGVKGAVLKGNQDAILSLIQHRAAEEAVGSKENEVDSRHSDDAEQEGNYHRAKDEEHKGDERRHSIDELDELMYAIIDVGRCHNSIYELDVAIDTTLKRFIDEFVDNYIDEHGLQIAVDTMITLGRSNQSPRRIWDWN